MKAIIKILTAQKEFSKDDMDCFRRIMNVLKSHDLAAKLTIKKKISQDYKLYQSQLKAV